MSVWLGVLLGLVMGAIVDLGRGLWVREANPQLVGCRKQSAQAAYCGTQHLEMQAGGLGLDFGI